MSKTQRRRGEGEPITIGTPNGKVAIVAISTPIDPRHRERWRELLQISRNEIDAAANKDPVSKTVGFDWRAMLLTPDALTDHECSIAINAFRLGRMVGEAQAVDARRALRRRTRESDAKSEAQAARQRVDERYRMYVETYLALAHQHDDALDQAAEKLNVSKRTIQRAIKHHFRMRQTS